MAFVNEVPTQQEIEQHHLPFIRHKELTARDRRTWTIDRERNFHLWGGLSSNPAFGEEVTGRFYLYLDGQRFRVILTPEEGSPVLTASPHTHIERWRMMNSISAIRPDLGRQIDLPRSAWVHPDVPQPLLGGRSLREFIGILKEALAVHGVGKANRNVPPPLVVQFGF